MGLLLLLILISFIDNAKKFDYNSVIALGIVYLSMVHPFLYRMYYFYMIIAFTVVVDGASIALLNGSVDAWYAVIIPSLEILIKAGVMIF